MWEFKLDEKLQLYANIYDCDENEDGTFTKRGTATPLRGGVTNGILNNRMEDMLDNIIVVEPFREGKKYYKTKGRTFVKIEKKGVKNYEVSGSYHNNIGQPLVTVDAYDGEDIRNGITLALDGVVMGTPNSVAKTLHDTVVPGMDPEHNDSIFSEFFGIVEACAVSKANSKNGWQAADQTYGNLFNIKSPGLIGSEDATTTKATYLLNNYHYTVYAPTNAAMEKAYAAGLPTLEDLAAAEEYDLEMGYSGPGSTTEDNLKSRADSIKEVMLDFVKYHIQDNAIFVDVDTAGVFETGKTELIKATQVDETTGEESWGGKYSPGRPYKLDVKVEGGQMYVTDCRNGYSGDKALGGNQTKVVIKDGAYNLMAREYWLESSGAITNPNNVRLNNSSFVVIHAIEDPLIFADGKHYDSKGNEIATQFTYTYKPLTSE